MVVLYCIAFCSLQAFSPTAGLYDNRDVYYTSSQADTLSTLAQYSGTDGRSSTHQQLNVQSSSITGAADD